MNLPSKAFQVELDTAKAWLFEAALPLWSDKGVDQKHGGFFERMTPHGEMLDDPRRTRLVARQIYAFATGRALGWKEPAADIVQHGLDFFTRKCLSPDGGVYSSVQPNGVVIIGTFDLYDHAFALFALAAAAKAQPEHAKAHEAATLTLLDHMEHGFKHPAGGFEEALPRTLPLKANPHMHILEAALTWSDTGDCARWKALAAEIVDLCLSRFINPVTGALHEFLDGDWRLLLAPPDDVVEPGHLFEWSWLLTRWGLAEGDDRALMAGRRMFELAETHGLCPATGLAVNELDGALRVRDGRFRLWPQTERLKAQVAQYRLASSAAEKAAALDKITEALRLMRRYFEHPVQGSWWEHFGPDGRPHDEPARASSLYHIVCAIAEVDDLRLEMGVIPGPALA